MSSAPLSTTERMTVEGFLDWAASRPLEGRYELVDGRPVAMAPERARHAAAKGEVYLGLRTAIAKAGIDCSAWPDGMGVRTTATTVREPDASVQCGSVDPSSMVLDAPVIVVEVVSLSSGRADSGAKLGEYFGVPSVWHYLVVHPEDGLVLHHRRAEGSGILTHIHRGGTITLDPPGLTLDLDPIVAAGSPEQGEVDR